MTTTAGDDAVEQAFEAWLAGRPVPPSEHRLVTFSDAVRASATAPGRPSAALADLLVTGLLTDQPNPSDATARSAGRAPARSRRRRLRMFAPAPLFAKIASAGLAAKAATVTGVVVVGFSTAGFTNTLPASVQHTFATVVDSATPFHAPDPVKAAATDTADTLDDTAGTSSESGDSNDPAGTNDPTTTNAGDQPSTDAGSGDSGTGTLDPSKPGPFGQQVSQLAHANKADGHPGVDGKVVSAAARKKHSGATDSTEDQQGDEPADNATGDSGRDASESDGSGDGATRSTDGSSSEDSTEGGSPRGGSHRGSGRGSGN